MRMRVKTKILVALALFFTLLSAYAFVTSGANYRISGSIAGGGTIISSASYRMLISIGQPLTGAVQSANYRLHLGYSYTQDSTPPSSNSPADAIYTAGSAGNVIGWILTDDTAPGYYRILRNGSVYASWAAWVNNTNLNIPVNTNAGVGVWNYTIEFNDSSGNPGTPDTVFITIQSSSSPNSPSGGSGGGGGGGAATSQGYPIFTVDNLKISPASVGVNETAIITVDVGNAGDVVGIYSAFLYLNGQLEQVKNITLASGEKETVNFTVAKAGAGEYNVKVSTLRGTLHVVEYTAAAIESVGTEDGAETKNLGTIEQGMETSVSFDKMDIYMVTLTLKRRVENAEISIRRLDTLQYEYEDLNRSDTSVYRYLNISSNIKDEDIEKVTLYFRVNKSWIRDEGVGSVSMNRYNKSWTVLPTVKTAENDAVQNYSASSPGLSTFAISGARSAAEFPITASAGAAAQGYVPYAGGGIAALLIVSSLLTLQFVRKKRRSAEAKGEDIAVLPAEKHVIGATCPFCGDLIKGNSSTITCESCKTPHHEMCWRENGGCTTFGCDRAPKKNS